MLLNVTPRYKSLGRHLGPCVIHCTVFPLLSTYSGVILLLLLVLRYKCCESLCQCRQCQVNCSVCAYEPVTYQDRGRLGRCLVAFCKPAAPRASHCVSLAGSGGVFRLREYVYACTCVCMHVHSMSMFPVVWGVCPFVPVRLCARALLQAVSAKSTSLLRGSSLLGLCRPSEYVGPWN
jgi:hypothetical protein